MLFQSFLSFTLKEIIVSLGYISCELRYSSGIQANKHSADNLLLCSLGLEKLEGERMMTLFSFFA